MAVTSMGSLTFLVLTCSLFYFAESRSRIIDGSYADISSYPFSASVLELGSTGVYSHSCGGSIITSTAILSAAQCFLRAPVEEILVRVGSATWSEGGTVYGVRAVHVHDQYLMLEHDVAVVRTHSFIAASPNVAAVTIAGPSYILPDDTPVTAIGWGRTEEGETSENLRQAGMLVISQAECLRRYGTASVELSDNILCAGILDVGTPDVCTGDTGGPLLHGDVVVGIASFSMSCAHEVYPAVWVRVSQYTDWIVSRAQQDN